MTKTNEEKQQAIYQAMDLLAQAEEALSDLDDGYINSYVIGHINAQGRYLGKGLYQELENVLADMKNE